MNEGTGKYSIVTLEDEGRKNEAYGRGDISAGHKNKTYQRDAFAFGGGLETGLTYQEWLDAGNTGTEEDYEKSYSFGFTTGVDNINKGRASRVDCENNKNYAPFSAISGEGNTNYGTRNFMHGRSLNSAKSGSNRHYNYCALIGTNLYPTNDFCTMVGRNNGDKTKGGKDLMFGVGCPELKVDEDGKVINGNGFEVYNDGTVRVNRTPTHNPDVVRLVDLNEALANISGSKKFYSHTLLISRIPQSSAGEYDTFEEVLTIVSTRATKYESTTDGHIKLPYDFTDSEIISVWATNTTGSLFYRKR